MINHNYFKKPNVSLDLFYKLLDHSHLQLCGDVQEWDFKKLDDTFEVRQILK